MTIAEARFVLCDTETGGTDEAADLLEIAARRLRSREAFETLVRPTKPIPPDASAVHHLVDADFDGTPSREDALASLEVFAGNADVIVAHHAEFDRAHVAPALAHHRWLCSERLAHHLVPEAPNFKLGTLYYYLGGEKITAALHRAAADLDPLDFIFGRLVDRYMIWAAEKCAGDVTRLAKATEVDSLLAFAARPYRLLTMPFGKHRGARFDDPTALPTSYLDWMLKPGGGAAEADADLRYTAEREYARRTGRPHAFARGAAA